MEFKWNNKMSTPSNASVERKLNSNYNESCESSETLLSNEKKCVFNLISISGAFYQIAVILHSSHFKRNLPGQ